MRKIGIGILVLVISILTFKFISWNFWKLQDAVDTAQKIIKAPAAVNLAISREGTTLLQESFAYNRKGNYYIINRFDISPYIRDRSLRVTVGKQPLSAFLLFRFTSFNVICYKDFYFIFFKDDCPIEEFIRWKDSMPLVVGSLYKLILQTGNVEEEKSSEIIYSFLNKPGIELSYGNGRLSRSIPVTFKKGLWYEMVVYYRVTGRARPVIMLTEDPFSPDSPVIRGVLDYSLPDRDGTCRAFIVFNPGTDFTTPLIHLLLRRPRRYKHTHGGKISFENIIFYRYSSIPPGMSDLACSGIAITNADFLSTIRKEFIEVFPVRL
jgi:hypothetical protein